VIVTSNKPFSGWGEIFGYEIVAAAMIDRLVHHAEILALKGDSYRLRDKRPRTRPRRRRLNPPAPPRPTGSPPQARPTAAESRASRRGGIQQHRAKCVPARA
jgi:hypothetical protein